MKRVYLIAIITLFLLLLVPYFENIATADVIFFGWDVAFISIFRLLIVGGMMLWSLLTIYIQQLITDIKLKQKQSKFELQ